MIEKEPGMGLFSLKNGDSQNVQTIPQLSDMQTADTYP
jgi:hypothetical protein